ncbi:DUF4349 domain-containing protein [Pedobacter sp. Hv1]|uniref:DUF4349 domain-containing protein n=1 Tax=Pedobacter sp. Hv1 TaxID=1740090 RepID=UPI0006D89DD4|nr:DUF4349 domain-containing protein [Pedobacter sp. Hv1]KQC00493.1 hypothetical protein AQF98_13550 [Pedobacter sp. Hv1]
MKKYVVCIVLALVVFGCSQEKKEYAATSEAIMADSTAKEDLPTKIIKTADMRFRVKDVQRTKEQLSATIKAQGGTVVEFSIQSSVQESDKVKYSVDSLKEITSYQKEGLLIAKIPSEKLDDFTNTVARMAVFVDHQAMKMDDQSIAYLANQLKAQNRVDAVKQINKVSTKKSANVESSLYIKDDYVDKKIENLNIDDKVKFSTITLNFYQDRTVNTFVVGNDNLYDYRPGFFQRLGLNIVDGWTIFKELILAISKMWMLVVLAVVLFFGIKYYIRNKK